MVLELKEINAKTDFPALARCLFESYEDPPQPFFHIFFPIHGEGEEAREEAIREAANRLKLWHTHDPSSYWQKVVDTENGAIAGGALWNIHKKNPFADPTPTEVTWFPEGGGRKYVEHALATHSAPRARVAQRPHVCTSNVHRDAIDFQFANSQDLFIIFTVPKYRRRGVGQQFMNWGMAKADELGYDLFLDSTPYGRPLYEANGLILVEENFNLPYTDNPDDAWKQVRERVGGFTFWLMWRPVGERS